MIFQTVTILILIAALLQPVVRMSSLEFPLKEFLNVSDEFYLDDTYYNQMCAGGRINGACCKCNSRCVERRQCCLDYLWITMNHTNISTYVNLITEIQKPIKQQECLLASPNADKLDYYSLTYTMVNTCLPNSNLWNVHLCSNESNIRPVLGDDGYLYKNEYCAKCNLVDIIYTVAQILECEGEPSNIVSCQVRLEFPNQNHYVCKPSLKNCHPNNEYYDLCNAFVAPFVEQLKPVYTNYFCYLCNKKEYEVPEFMNIICINAGEGTTPFPISWSSILRIDDPLKNVLDHEFCKNGKLLDDHLGRCVNFYCPLGYHAMVSKCERNSKYLESESQNQRITFDDCFFSQRITLYLVDLRKSLEYFNLKHTNWSQRFIFNKNRTYNVIEIELPNETAWRDGIMPELHDIRSFLEREEEVHLHLSGVHADTSPFNMSRFIKGKNRCHKADFLRGEVQFSSTCDVLFNETSLPKWIVSMVIEIRKGEIKRNVYRCDTLYSFDGCPLRILGPNVTIHENRSIVNEYNGKKEMYNLNEYNLLEDGEYAVCMKSITSTLASRPSWYLTITVIDGYVSVIGTTFSLVCYIILLIKYYYNECYSVPNLSTCALYITLFFGDGIFFALNMMFVFGVKPVLVICNLMVAIEQFFLISSQIWCVAMAYDISKSIRVNNIFSEISKKSRFVKYCCGVYIGSMIIVGTAVYLRESSVFFDTDRDVCSLFDSGLYVRIILHISPLVLSFLFSALFIARATCYVSHENRENNRILNRKSRINITKITLKLIILCGIPEGIGLVNIPKTSLSNAESSVNLIFGLLYSMSKGFRGVMLLLLYICKTADGKKNSEINLASDVGKTRQ